MNHANIGKAFIDVNETSAYIVVIYAGNLSS